MARLLTATSSWKANMLQLCHAYRNLNAPQHFIRPQSERNGERWGEPCLSCICHPARYSELQRSVSINQVSVEVDCTLWAVLRHWPRPLREKITDEVDHTSLDRTKAIRREESLFSILLAKYKPWFNAQRRRLRTESRRETGSRLWSRTSGCLWLTLMKSGRSPPAPNREFRAR
jgi:hypothetical protein